MWYKNGTVFNSQQAIRLDNPNTSLPSFISDEMVESLGYMKVIEAEKPNCTEVQYLVDGNVELVDDVPIKGWKVVDRFSDTAEYTELDGTVIPAMTKEEQEVKFYADKTEAEAKALKDAYTTAMENFMDAQANTKGYTSRYTASLRVNSTVAKFKAEGQAYMDWMDTCYNLGYTVLAEVVNGIRPMPTIEEFLAELPKLDW